jgi:hypothetical protein
LREENQALIALSCLWNTGGHAKKVRGKIYRTLSISRNEFMVLRLQINSEYFSYILFIAPVIISPPENSYGPLGANLTLDCEARGFPAPTITWQFVSTEGKTISLPSKFTQFVCIFYGLIIS